MEGSSSGQRNQETSSLVPVSSVVNSPPLPSTLPADNNGFVTVDSERWSDGSDFSLTSVSSTTPSVLSFGSSVPHTVPQSPVDINSNSASRSTLLRDRDAHSESLSSHPDQTFSLLRYLTHLTPTKGRSSAADEATRAPAEALTQQQSEVAEPVTPAAAGAPTTHSVSSSPLVDQLAPDMMAFGIQQQGLQSSSPTPTLPIAPAQIPIPPNGEINSQSNERYWPALYPDMQHRPPHPLQYSSMVSALATTPVYTGPLLSTAFGLSDPSTEQSTATSSVAPPQVPVGEVTSQSEQGYWKKLYLEMNAREVHGPVARGFDPVESSRLPQSTAFGLTNSMTRVTPPKNPSIANPSGLPVSFSSSTSHSTVPTDAGLGTDVDSETDMTSVASTVKPQDASTPQFQPQFPSPARRIPFPSFTELGYEEENSEVIMPVGVQPKSTGAVDSGAVDLVTPMNEWQQYLEVQPDSTGFPLELTMSPRPTLMAVRRYPTDEGTFSMSSLYQALPRPPSPPPLFSLSAQFDIAPEFPKLNTDIDDNSCGQYASCTLFAEPSALEAPLVTAFASPHVLNREVASPTSTQDGYRRSAPPRNSPVGRRYSGYGMYTDSSDSDADAECETQDSPKEEPQLPKGKERETSPPPKATTTNIVKENPADESPFSEEHSLAVDDLLSNPKMSSLSWDRRAWVYSPVHSLGGNPAHAIEAIPPHRPSSPWMTYGFGQPLAANEAPTPDLNKASQEMLQYNVPHYIPPAYLGGCYGFTPKTPHPPIPPNPMDSRLSTSGATRGSTPEVTPFIPPRASASSNPSNIQMTPPSSSSSESSRCVSPHPRPGQRARVRTFTIRAPSSTQSQSRSPSPPSTPIVTFRLPMEDRHPSTKGSSKPIHQLAEKKRKLDSNAGVGCHHRNAPAYPSYPPGAMSSTNPYQSTGPETPGTLPWIDFDFPGHGLPALDNTQTRSLRTKQYHEFAPTATPNHPRALPVPPQGASNMGVAGTPFTRLGGNACGHNIQAPQDSSRRWSSYLPNATNAPQTIVPNYSNTNHTPNWYATPGQQSAAGWAQPQHTPAWVSPWPTNVNQPSYPTPGYTFPGGAPGIPPIAPMMGTSTLPPSTSSLPGRTANLPFHSTGAYPVPPFNQNPGQPPQQISYATPHGGSYHNVAAGGWFGGMAPQVNPVVYVPHAKFCFPDANISLLVQNLEYRVHRYFFEYHSTYLKELFAPYPLHNIEPIPLNTVSSIDFDRLLRLFYPSDISEPELTAIEEWTSVLTLSSLWQMKDLRKRAIKELTHRTTPVQRILLYRQHKVNEWALSAYQELCMSQTVSLEEGEQLGMRTVLKIWEAQQQIIQRNCCRLNCCKATVDEIIKIKFGLP